MPFLIYDPGASAPGFMLSPASRALPVNFASTPNPILNLKNISITSIAAATNIKPVAMQCRKIPTRYREVVLTRS